MKSTGEPESGPYGDEVASPPIYPGEDLYLTIGPRGVRLHDVENPNAWIKSESFENLKWCR